MVFYRKYRPQRIDELDSSLVREKLASVLSQKDVPHAFLFTGPKGLGKTSAARIMAKVVNCEARNVILSSSEGSNKKKRDSSAEPQNDNHLEPCNNCSQCVSITNGTNLDVLEIDGASNRGIDEIRDLREKVGLTPLSSRKKVYIIDEVHMLTTEAFNALLKTLEEPPSHVIFILCTTEPHKVPPTIVSRCFHIPFQRATNEELKRSFFRIMEREKLDIDNETLEAIARLSDGGFRDGAKILEEMVALAKDKKITKELVEEKYQISSIKHQVSELLDYLNDKDTKSAITLISKLVEQGVDFKYFIGQLIGELHHQLLAQVGVEEVSDIRYQLLSIEDIRKLIGLFSKAYTELKYAVLPQLPLELAVIEWGIPSHVILSPAERDEKSLSHSDDRTKRSFAPLSGVQDYKKVKDSVEDDIWKKFIEKVKSYSHSIAGVLRGCSLKAYNKKEFIIETKYKFHKEKLEEKNTRELLEKVGSEVTGQPIQISIEFKG